MKKILTGAMAVCLLAALAVSTAAIADEERTDVTVYYNTPTIDGTINNGEWDYANAIDVTADNAMLWEGDEINNVVYFYYSWDEKGLYLAADVSDTDVCVADDISVLYSSNDAFQIAIDPAGLIGDDAGSGAMFYSIGPMKDGNLGAVYHPYGGAAEEFEYTGAYRITNDGWEFEMLIPWTSIEILGGDGYDWKHADGEIINALLCVLDREEEGTVSIAYQITKTGAVTFLPEDYPLELHLSTYVAPSLEVEEPEADEPAVEEPVVDTPAESAPTTADAGIVAAAAVMAVAAGVVLSKKN